METHREFHVSREEKPQKILLAGTGTHQGLRVSRKRNPARILYCQEQETTEDSVSPETGNYG
jgi:hypothetical protein